LTGKYNKYIFEKFFRAMLVKSNGVVLQQIRYSDSAIVVQAYTREMGRQSFMVKGLRSKKSGRHSALFQPLFMLDMVFYFKISGTVHLLKEFSVKYLPANIYSDVKKSCIALFLGEVLTSVLREEAPDYGLYGFIEDSVKYLDNSGSDFSNFHLSFLISLSSYLGFEPGIRTNPSDKYFDLLNGKFIPGIPAHQDFAGREISEILAMIYSTSYEGAAKIPLTGKMRNEVLETILRYYSIHLPGLKRIKSLEVLKEIFN